MNIECVSNANSLVAAYKKARKDSDWKESVQRYGANLLVNTFHLQKAIRDGSYAQKPFYEFNLSERGKTRHIKAMHISDRVAQRATCDELLLPALKDSLVYDNGASLEGKGVDFTRRRLVKHLSDFYRKYGSDGYVLQIDFAKFFDNIPHDKLLAAMGERIKDKATLDFVRKQFDAFKIDVSYLSDDAVKLLELEPFNSLDYYKVNKTLLTGEKFMRRSVGIGSQISQIAGIFYPTPVDIYCKVVMGCKFYGRYMDDIYIIHRDKEFLKKLLAGIKKQTQKLGMFINERKTQVVKLQHGFTFLQLKYNFSPTGKVIQRLARSTITRERRRLKKFKHLVDKNVLSFTDVKNCYSSWRGSYLRFDSYKSIRNMDALFNSLFKEELCNDTRGKSSKGERT